MAVLFSFGYLFVAAIHVSGTLGFLNFEDYAIPVDRWLQKLPQELHPWDPENLRYRSHPKWLFPRKPRYDYDYNNVRYDPVAGWVSNEATSTANTEKLGSVKGRWKYLSKGIPRRSVDYTWSKDNTGGHSHGLRQHVLRSRLDEGADHSGAVSPDGDKRTVVLAKNSRVQPLKSADGGRPVIEEFIRVAAKNEVVAKDLGQKSTDGEREMIETTDQEENWTTIGSNEETDQPESGVEANKNGTSEIEAESEADDITAEETGTTESVPVSSGVEETTTPSVHDKVDNGTHTVDDTISERIPISKSSLSATKVTFKETAATVQSTVDHSSPKETSPSTTTFPSSEGTVSETVPSNPPTAGDSSSGGTSQSKTPLPSSVVPVSETVSPTLPTAGESSSESPTTSVPEHAIVLPRIRTARIVLSSVLLAIGLVAVAVAAVCIFRERRRKLKYDQLKLLP